MINTGNIGEARPHLTKHIRLVCYSYLDAKTVLNKISFLSKEDRSSLEESVILTEGKSLTLKLNNLLKDNCFLHDTPYRKMVLRQF